MGIVQKKYRNTKKQILSEEQKLEKDLRECMKCKFFWGNNHRCAVSKCYKSKTKNDENSKLPPKCVGCPYKQSDGYCFPCMKDILGRK